MTTRERWIVYPLLMFSLMMGIKTRYFQDTFVLKAEKIECSDLTVTLINGRPARLTAIIPRISPPAANPQTKARDGASLDETQSRDQPSDEPAEPQESPPESGEPSESPDIDQPEAEGS